MLAVWILAFADPSAAVSRAIAYLAEEVPRWSRENGCFSCHNDGDGARALLRAQSLGHSIPAGSAGESIGWLQAPEKWDAASGDAVFKDKMLSRVQFTAALAVAPRSDALARAAEALASSQATDGSWRIEGEQGLGSPATYGTILATSLSRGSLIAADRLRYAPRIRRAEAFLLRVKPRSVMDAAAVLLALPDNAAVRGSLLPFLLRAQGSSGGWGPHSHAPPEAFDTSLALLALAAASPGAHGPIAKGRAYLVSSQLVPGGWPGTTRPAGSQSYAQHISTTAWALLALLETDVKRK